MTITRQSAIEAGCCEDGVDEVIEALGLDPDGEYEIEAIIDLAREVDRSWVRELVYYAPGLSTERRIKIVREDGIYWLGSFARYAHRLSPEQRIELAREAGGEWLSRVARRALDLSVEQRKSLLKEAKA